MSLFIRMTESAEIGGMLGTTIGTLRGGTVGIVTGKALEEYNKYSYYSNDGL